MLGAGRCLWSRPTASSGAGTKVRLGLWSGEKKGEACGTQTQEIQTNVKYVGQALCKPERAVCVDAIVTLPFFSPGESLERLKAWLRDANILEEQPLVEALDRAPDPPAGLSTLGMYDAHQRNACSRAVSRMSMPVHMHTCPHTPHAPAHPLLMPSTHSSLYTHDTYNTLHSKRNSTPHNRGPQPPPP